MYNGVGETVIECPFLLKAIYILLKNNIIYPISEHCETRNNTLIKLRLIKLLWVSRGVPGYVFKDG